MEDTDVLQKALAISDFVTSPDDLFRAVQAADEIWKVATGTMPLRPFLSGLKTANPRAFWTIMLDLAEFIEHETGQKLTSVVSPPAEPQTTPLDLAISAMAQRAKGTFAEGNEPYFLQQCAARMGIPEIDLVERIAAGNLEGVDDAYQEALKDERRRMV